MVDIDRAMVTDRPDEFLITAIRKNDLATACHLLNCNVSPDEPYSDPPLSVAIRHQRLDIVQLLYEHNVKGIMDEFNTTEIHVAASVGNLAILEFIWNKLKP
jgi:ankyrin repeat protein